MEKGKFIVFVRGCCDLVSDDVLCKSEYLLEFDLTILSAPCSSFRTTLYTDSYSYLFYQFSDELHCVRVPNTFVFYHFVA